MSKQSKFANAVAAVGLHQDHFKEESYSDENTQPDQSVQMRKIQLLEIFVEKSKSMALGQRLYWHLHQINKQISLYHLPDTHDYYLRALNASYKLDLKSEQQQLHQKLGIQQSDEESESSSFDGGAGFKELKKPYPQNSGPDSQDIALYCPDSNTVFYYNEYKVCLLLDFSKSTSTVYPYQEKSYVEKLQDAIEIFIHNMWFKLNSKYHSAGSANTQQMPKGGKKLSSFKQIRSNQAGVMELVSTNAAIAPGEQHHQTIQEVTEELEDFSPPKKTQAFGFQNDSSNNNSSSATKPMPSSSSFFNKERSSFLEGGPSHSQTNEYIPAIYLSIAASGLPPNNNMRLLIHNQRLDDQNRNEVLKSLKKRLELIVDQLAESYNCTATQCAAQQRRQQNYSRDESMSSLYNYSSQKLIVDPAEIEGSYSQIEPQPEYLQKHLCNAQKILNLMRAGAKPLLVVMTDATCSLMGRAFFGGKKNWLDSVISRLHANDTKIITLDLGDQNRIANTFGFVNHDEHLKYLAYLTCGAHFDYQTLIKLAGKFSNNYSGNQRFAPSVSLYGGKNNQNDFISIGSHYQPQVSSTIGLGLIKANSVSTTGQVSLGLHGIHSASLKNRTKVHHSNQQVHYHKNEENQDLSQNDEFHVQLNSLQKLMFARPCNYSAFLQHEEIQKIVNFQERQIFENRISSSLIKQLRKEKNLPTFSGFSTQDLLLNGRFTPIFLKEQLAEYTLDLSRASQICEHRSRKCFQFRKLSIIDSQKDAQQIRKSEHFGNPLDHPGSKIYYQYWWSNQILILCSIEQLENGVHVKYKVVAQEEVIYQLKRASRQMQAKAQHKQKNSMRREHYQDILAANYSQYCEASLLEQLTYFIKEVQKSDQQFELFQIITADIKRVYKVIRQREVQFQTKFQQKEHSFSSAHIGEFEENKIQLMSKKDRDRASSARFLDDEFEQMPLSTSKAVRKRSNQKLKVSTSLKQEIQEQTQKDRRKETITENQARKILAKHNKSWHRLCKISISQWAALFQYLRLDLITQSSIEQFVQETDSSFFDQIESMNQLDSLLSNKVFVLLKQFTTFTLHSSTFIQVFKERRQSSRHSGHYEERKHFGFCLIKVQWAAANIAVCHFGFHKVSPKTINSFIQQFKRMFMNTTTSDEGIGEKERVSFQVYDKQVASLLNKEENFLSRAKAFLKDEIERGEQNSRQKHAVEFESILYSSSINHPSKKLEKLQNQQDIRKNQHQLLQFRGGYEKQEDICYHKQWLWKNENAVTNRDFFESLVRQRLSEGFIFVNRGCNLHHHHSQENAHSQEDDNNVQTENNLNTHDSDAQTYVSTSATSSKELEEKYLFVKIVKANKLRKNPNGTHTGSRRQSNRTSGSKIIQSFQEMAVSGALKQTQQQTEDLNQESDETTFVVIQFLIIFEKPQQLKNPFANNSSSSEPLPEVINSQTSENMSFRTELLMEQETCYFLLEKQTHGHTIPEICKNADGYIVSDKNFFHELYEYISSQDQHLFNNTCSYHNIVKNSMLKVTSTPSFSTDNSPVKYEVCFFKNLFADGVLSRSLKIRKRMKLELAVRSKMQLLRRDWREFLKNDYPELFSTSTSASQEELKESKDGYHKQHNHGTDEARIIEENSFVLQVEDLIENSRVLGQEPLPIPTFMTRQYKPEKCREVFTSIYDNIIKAIEDFCDFQISKSTGQQSIETYLYFAKLATKQILFILKVPTKKEFLDCVLSHRQTPGIQYFRLSKSMLRVPKLSKNRIYHLLNQQRISSTSSNDIYQCTPCEYEQENINQIDQISDFIFYYESSMREGTQSQLQFEPNVHTIIKNFQTYLKAHYDIIFANTVLMNLPNVDEPTIYLSAKEDIKELDEGLEQSPGDKSESEIHEIRFNHEAALEQLQIDFQRIKSTLTRCRFRMDISFLCLIVYHLIFKQEKFVGGTKENHEQFEYAMDEVFNDIISRNFCQFSTVDPDFHVFQKNEQFDETFGQDPKMKPQTQKRKKHSNLSEQYLYNLEGTKDSYSDSEISENEEKHKRKCPAHEQTSKIKSASEVYASCKKLLFKVELQMRNSEGKVLVEKKLSKYSQIFCEENRQTVIKICEELAIKAKHIVDERHRSQQKQNDVQYNYDLIECLMAEEAALDRECQAAIEIYFSFYTVPQYVGIIRDSDVDYLCIEQDEILVNDDDHEDLIRVTKLNELINSNCSKNSRLEFEDQSLFKQSLQIPLFKPFNKKQLVKSVPYYFKASDCIPNKDYRVYFYDEIHRKIIYGILRRTYALLGQAFLENLSIITYNIDPLNILILQKYMGALMFSQRHEKQICILDNISNGRIKMAERLLLDELKTTAILNCGNVKFGDKSDEIFFVKSSQRLKNFFLKNQMEHCDQVPFQLDPTNMTDKNFFSFGNNFKSKELHELEKYEQQQVINANEDFEIPFWVAFKLDITTDQQSHNHSLRINLVYHLPMYKCHQYLDDQQVEKEFKRCFDLISMRLKVMLLLNQVDEKREMPQTLKLGVVQPLKKEPSVTLSQTTLLATQNRMEQAKNKILGDQQQQSPAFNPLLKQNSTRILNLQPALLGNQSSNSTSTNKPASTVTSRFKMRMDKIKQQQNTNKEENAQESSIQPIPEESHNQMQSHSEPILRESTITPKNASLLSQSQEVLKVNKVFQHSFQLYHSIIRVEDGIKAIQDTTFLHFRIEDQNNLFVTKRENSIYLIKISGHQQSQGPASDQMVKQALLKSFNNNIQGHFNQSIQEQTQSKLKEDQSINMDEARQSLIKSPITSITPNQTLGKMFPSATGASGANLQAMGYSQILMEIFSTSPPLKRHIEPLIQSIEMNLTKITIEKLAENLNKHPGQITLEDFSYIERSDQKLLFAFPIDNCPITDKYALLKYLKQNLSRFFFPVEITQTGLQKMRNQTGTSLQVDEYGVRDCNTQSILSGNSPNKLEDYKARRRTGQNGSFFQIHPTSHSFHNPNEISEQVSSSLVENNLQESQLMVDPYDDSSSVKRVESNDQEMKREISVMSELKNEVKILYQPDDFTLLYNFKSSKLKKGQNQGIQNTFGQALGLTNISIHNQFNISALQQNKLGDSNQTTDNEDLLKELFKRIEYQFQIEDEPSIMEENRMQAGLKSTPDHANCTFKRRDAKLKYFMPLVYQTSKCNDQQLNENMFKNINEGFQIPISHYKEQSQKWLVIKLSYMGQLQTDLFLKNMILNVNQTINECLIELYIKSILQSPQKPLINNEGGLKLTPIFNQEKEESKSIQLKQPTLKGENSSFGENPYQSIQGLENLLDHGSISITNMIRSFEKMIYGDSSDIICTLIYSLVTNFHFHFKQLTKQQSHHGSGWENCSMIKDSNEWTINLIVEFINKHTNNVEKIIIFQFKEELAANYLDEFLRDLQIHLNKCQTILRNVHPQFKLLLGSFNLKIPFSQNNVTIIRKEYSATKFQFSGLKPDSPQAVQDEEFYRMPSEGNNATLPEGREGQKSLLLHDRLANLKVYSNIETSLKFNVSGTEISACICQPRNFFMIISLKDQKLSYKSFNLEKKIQKQCKDIVFNNLIWHSNRHHFFKRIISQKLGTVYTLKDFYSSDHLIKDQTISHLYSSSKFTYEKAATIIEGKQVYNFTKALKRQRKGKNNTNNGQYDPMLLENLQKQRRMRRRNAKLSKFNEQQEGGKSPSGKQIKEEEYLKALKTNEGFLKELQKKSQNIDLLSSKPPQVFPENSHHQHQKMQSAIIPTQKQRLISQLKPDLPEEIPIDNGQGKKALKPSKQVVGFEEFIQNKVISKQFGLEIEKALELRLTHMYVISPSLQPSRANIIMAAKQRTQGSSNTLVEGKKLSFNEMLIEKNEINNKTLIANPLFFHGMRMIKMLQCFFNRIKQAQRVATMYKQCDDYIVKKQQDTSKEKQLLKGIVEELTTGGHLKLKKEESLVKVVQLVISRSRLLSSNTTQQLFDLNLMPYESQEDLVDDYTLQEPKRGLQTGERITSQRLKLINDELRKDFLNEYNAFLLTKVGVMKALVHLFIPGDQSLMDQMPRSKRQRAQQKSKSKTATSQVSFRKQRSDAATAEELPPNFKRSKKYSEDIILDDAGGDGESQHLSGSSMVMSSQQMFEQTRRRQERVLHQISEETTESPMLTYIVKNQCDDSLIIYELSYSSGLIRVNVYKFDAMVKSFPRSVASNYNVLQTSEQAKQHIIERKALATSEEQSLSTKLNTDSFNYDFHLKEISNQIVVANNKQSRLSLQLSNLLAFYKTPPVFARNYCDVVVLHIDLGYLHRVSELEFLQYFSTKCKQYGFKIFYQPLYQAETVEQSTIEPQIKYAFYKEEGLKPKIENFEQTKQQQLQYQQVDSTRRTISMVSQSRKHSNAAGLELVEEGEEEKESDEIYSRRSRILNEHQFVSNRPQQNRGNHQLMKTLGSSTALLNNPLTSSSELQQQASSRKLFYIELRDQAVHPKDCDVFKKVWNVQCRKQESSDSQIGADDEAKKTVLELVFYMIYTVPMSDGYGANKKNSERYPLQEVCQDMSRFIHQVETSFSECRKELLKDQMWTKFFDQGSRDIPLTDAQLSDMLKFSYSYDLKTADDRYRDLLTMDLHNKKFYDYIRYSFSSNCRTFNTHLHYGAMVSHDADQQILPDLLIFDPEIRHFLIHVEFSYALRKVNIYLVRKDNFDFRDNASILEEESAQKDQQYDKKFKPRQVQELMTVEEILIKQVFNHLAFWLWKRVV